MTKQNIVTVQFKDYCHKTYDFFNVFEEVNIGDHVVVDTVRGVGVAKVVDIKSYSHQANKHVIQRVDIEAHEKRMEAEKRRSELEQALLARKQELEKLEAYRQLAQRDEKMATLLDEYETLNKSSS